MNLGTFTYESGPLEYEEFPITDEPVFILGEPYSAKHDRDELKHDIRSRLWITYRRNFQHIGGTGPASDQGWGCMLRCGQMMMAQALVLHHLSRSWRWTPGCTNEKYWNILRMFEDRKMATFSIHQIASMGEAEGKAVGQWFGPNTIAQVLKRIAVYDDWSKLVIHVSLDNLVILEDILKLCKPAPEPSKEQQANRETSPNLLPRGEKFSQFVNDPHTPTRVPPSYTEGVNNNFSAEEEGSKEGKTSNLSSSSSSSSLPSSEVWKPLVLIIPLRLGLTETNPCYYNWLKKCFTMKQSIGIIGGKPNHAHWFIGYVGKELIYLDPHTTQSVVDLDSRSMTSDLSYHCDTPPSRMSFSKLDPSIALGFYCATESDLRELLSAFSDTSPALGRQMFEVRETAPQLWTCDSIGETVSVSPGVTGGRTRGISLSDFASVDGLLGSGTGSSQDEEEFEML